MVDYNCQQSEDRATLRSDPSAGWFPRGRCHTVSLFFIAFRRTEVNTGGGAPEEQAINLGGLGAEPPEVMPLVDFREVGTPLW